MAGIQSNEPIGTPARLAVARLAAARLAGVPRTNQLLANGLYSWLRSDGVGGQVNYGQPPVSAAGGWSTGRS